MELPFIYKYQPLYIQDFELDDKILQLIQILLEMDNLKIFFWGNHLFKHLNSIHITGNQLENEYKKKN